MSKPKKLSQIGWAVVGSKRYKNPIMQFPCKINQYNIWCQAIWFKKESCKAILKITEKITGEKNKKHKIIKVKITQV